MNQLELEEWNCWLLDEMDENSYKDFLSKIKQYT